MARLARRGGVAATRRRSIANASGIPLPGDDQTGWSLAYANDFTTDMALGAVVTTGDDAPFPAPYAADLWAFPTGWDDDNAILNADDSQYDSENTLSISGSKLIQHLSVISGSARSTVVGVVPGGTGRLYGRYQVCFRVPVSFHGWKTAWLLWPDSEVWPRDGEIDFPEGNIESPDEMDGFLHHQGAVSGGDQTGFNSGVAYVSTGMGGGWHVATIEWAADYCRFILNGTIVGTSYERVPNTAMSWRLMTVVQYTNFPTDQPGALDAGTVEIDWVAIWDDNGFVPFGFTQPSHTSVFTEAFTGTNGAAWDTGRWVSTTTTSGSTGQIQTNRGRLTTGTTGSYVDKIIRTANITAPVDLMAEFTVRITTLSECFPRAVFRDPTGACTNGYYVHLEPSSAFISLRRLDSGVETVLVDMDHTYTLNEELVCEVLAVGSEIQVRIWPSAGSRPTPPSLGTTDTTHSTGTKFSLVNLGGAAASARTVEFDALTISSVP